ncbi:hypothetical protein [Sutcliffiella horikoshii]|uniref:hypothetical protein n=1 Tax=Sutcliffiella horikoshii TaxID=79883 RepID=UPI003CE6CE83
MVDPYQMSTGGDPMFQMVPIFIGIIFVIVIGSILISVFKGVGEWQKKGDNGVLSFQGTRYLGFERNKASILGGEDYQGDYK